MGRTRQNQQEEGEAAAGRVGVKAKKYALGINDKLATQLDDNSGGVSRHRVRAREREEMDTQGAPTICASVRWAWLLG